MKYIIYSRKSTDTEDKQALSLDSQERELLDIAEKQNLEVVKTLRESKSAKEPGRPIFNEMMKIISTGKADAILCWKIDRLTRNPVDGGQIQWLLQNNKIKCIRTFEKSYYPNDNVLLMSIEQAMASQYIRDLSINVKRGNREKLARGEWPNHAPFGYLNDKATKTVIIDPIRSKYVLRAYELYLTGSYSFRDITKTLFDEGLRTNTGRKVQINQIQRILCNPFYTGLMERDRKYYEGKHQPIISKQTFDEAQQLLLDSSRPRLKKLFFPLRGFMKCAVCGCALTASIKKGHHYYYCTNRKEVCEEHKSYMRETYLYDVFADVLQNLDFSERKIEIMYQAAKEQLEQDSGYSHKVLETLQSQLESLKTKESLLLDTFLAEQITKELYDSKILTLQNERVSLTKQLKEAKEKEPASVLEPTKNVFLQGSRAMKEFLDGDDFKKRKVLENLCWNLSFKDKSVAQVSLKGGYQAMFKAPKNGTISELLGSLGSNQNCMRQRHKSYH